MYNRIGLNLELYILGIASLAGIMVFFIYANPVDFYFLNDDFVHVPLAASGNFFNGTLLRPVADMSLWVDAHIWGDSSFGFHLTNLLIHLANTVVFFLFYYRMMKRRRLSYVLERSVFVALLFLIYAFHSESIFWIIGRGGSLSAFFILIALYCYTFSRSNLSLIISLASFILGLFTYESVWVLPIVILIIQIFEYAFVRDRKPAWRWSISFGLVFIVYILLRLIFQNGFFGNYESGLILSGEVSRLLYNYIATLGRLFLPPTTNSGLFAILCGLSLLLLVLFVVAGLKERGRKLPAIIVPFVCVLISCVPTISMGIDTHDTEGERFLYVPSIFGCWLISEIVYILVDKFRYRLLVISCLLAFHCYFFIQSSHTYRYASSITKGSIDCMMNAPSAKVLNIQGLPSQYKGALIFRSGFESAVQWMMPDKYQRIIILSNKVIEYPAVFRCVSSGKFLVPRSSENVTVTAEWTDYGMMDIK